ncbi:beta strand repeat-containing protein [Paraburkholderia sp.]|uniref:beta strand repeat-containing protein n=1 Tax=Paraburkholderia sp. TaxID=1926495 RepID=UPI0039E21E00
MAQLKQVCTVTNGSQTVTVIGVNVAYRIRANNIFMVANELVPYVIATNAVFDGTNTTFTLAGAYQGPSAPMTNGVVATDFTVPDNLPLISQGDVGTAAIWTNTMYKIQAMISEINPTGFAASIADIHASLNGAQQAQQAAAASQTAAATSASAALASQNAAKTSETNAKTSETNAASSKTAAASSATAAAASQTASKTSETNSASSASAASSSQAAAASSSTSAANSASAAGGSATAAASSASAAKTSETNAKTSETNSKTSETNAAASAAAALASQNASKTSETNAAGSATAAAGSATAASNSATSAASSLTAVQGILTTMNALYLGQKASDPTKDNNGAALAVGAEYFNTTNKVMRVYTSSGWQDVDQTSETMAANATVSASQAAGSATAAANSAAAASGSATAASNSASAASSSQGAAATSASNAKTSETNSKTSETNAKTSETNSKTSETNAAASAASAAATAATIGNPVSKNGDTMAGDLWVGDPTSTAPRTLGTNYRVGITRNSAGVTPYQVITNGQNVLASPPTANYTMIGSVLFRWASTTSDVLGGQTAADIQGYSNADGTGAIGLMGRNATGAIATRLIVNGNGGVSIGTTGNYNDGSTPFSVNPLGTAWAAINTPTARFIDTLNGTGGGISIESYQPTIQFVDRSASAKNTRLMQNAGVLTFANDPGDNSGTYGAAGVAINADGYMAVGVGAAQSVNVAYCANGASAGTTTAHYAFMNNQTFNSAATSGGYSFTSRPQLAAASFTMANLIGFYADVPTIGAGSTVTNYTGAYVQDFSGAGTNIAYRGRMASGTNKWNLYMDGSASNLIVGQMFFGSSANAATDSTTAVTIQNPPTGQGLLVYRNGQKAQYIGIGSGTNLDSNAQVDNKIVGYSAATAAKQLFIHATTDETGTTPTNGSVGISFKVLNATYGRFFQSGNFALGSGVADDGVNALQVVGSARVTGNLLHGTTTPIQVGGNTAGWQNHATDSSGALTLMGWGSTSFGGTLNLASSRGTTIGTPAAVASGDTLGAITFTGTDTAMPSVPSAVIKAAAVEAFTSTAHGTRLDFQVTPATTVTSIYAMRITDSGRVLINTTTDNGSDALQVQGPATGYGVSVTRNGSTNTQYIGIGASPASNKTNNYIDSYSSASNAKILILNSTTDANNSAVTSGSLGINLCIMGTQKLSVMGSGNVLVNTGNDNNTDAFQVSGSGYFSTGVIAPIYTVRNAAATVYSSLSTSSITGLTIESYNSGNTTKYPVAIAPYGGQVLIGTTSNDGSNLLQVAGAVKITGNSTQANNTPLFILNDTSGASYGDVRYQSSGVMQWAMRGNSGGAFAINRYNASGVLQDSPLNISFSTGAATFTQRPTFNGNTAVDTGNIAALTQGRLIGVRVFTSSGTYTPTPGTNSIIAEAQAGGGGGAGCLATAAGCVAVGSAGQPGAYARGQFTSGFSSVAVTVGAAGAPGVTGGAGGDGGQTSFGSLLVVNGGAGGSVGRNDGPNSAANVTAALATVATGGNILNSASPIPRTSWAALSLGLVMPTPRVPSPIMGFAYGWGGRGSGQGQSASSALVGDTGGQGVVIIYEYA